MSRVLFAEHRLPAPTLQIVRWIWEDLFSPGPLLERLERAFARGRRL